MGWLAYSKFIVSIPRHKNVRVRLFRSNILIPTTRLDIKASKRWVGALRLKLSLDIKADKNWKTFLEPHAQNFLPLWRTPNVLIVIADVSHRLRSLPGQLQAQVRHQTWARSSCSFLRFRRSHQSRFGSEEKLWEVSWIVRKSFPNYKVHLLLFC